MPPQNEAQESNPEVAASQEVQPGTLSHASGSATLDAEAASTANPTGEPIADPIATNFSANVGTGEGKTAGVSPSSGSGEGPETGRIHLQGDSDTPAPNLQENPPTGDPSGLPIDSEVNLPE